jgi:hypothetical protein
MEVLKTKTTLLIKNRKKATVNIKDLHAAEGIVDYIIL